MATMQLDKKTVNDWQPDMHGKMRLMFFTVQSTVSQDSHVQCKVYNISLMCNVWMDSVDKIKIVFMF